MTRMLHYHVVCFLVSLLLTRTQSSSSNSAPSGWRSAMSARVGTGRQALHTSISLARSRVRPTRWFSRFRSPSSHYRQLLIEQRDLLEQQLRKTKEEAAQLRKKYKSLQASKLSDIRNNRLASVKKQLAAVDVELKKMTKLKEDLEKMLEEEQEKVRQLQNKIDKINLEFGEVKDRHERELADLRREMEEQATRRLEELRIMMEQRMQEALERAQLAAAREREEALFEIERRMQVLAEKQLQEERKKAEEAVEREKVKMRKLIKALAEREKKLLSQAEREKAKPTKTSQKTSSSQTQQTTPGTIRGPRT